MRDINLLHSKQLHSFSNSNQYLTEGGQDKTVIAKSNRVMNENLVEQTPLAVFVRERLVELGLKQADFCRQNTFDQGMLSRIQNSATFNLNLESVLKLAVGLRVSPVKILGLIGRLDLNDLIVVAYALDESNQLNVSAPFQARKKI